MKNSADIKKMVKKILRRQKGLQDHQMIHPRREWMIGFLCGLVVLLAGGTWSYITYQEVGTRDIDTVTVTEVQQTGYRGELINNALRNFETRNADYKSFLEGTQLPVELPTPDDEEIPEPEAVPDEDLPPPITPPADDLPIAEGEVPPGPPVAPADVAEGF